MGELKRIVIEHCPVDKLPEELRRGLASGQMVRVVVEQADGVSPQPLSELAGCAPGLVDSPQNAVEAIRELRDEWDHR